MFCILHYYYCVFQENELSTDSDFMWVNEAARFGSLASFLQPPAFKLEILLDHTKERVFTQVFHQLVNTRTSHTSHTPAFAGACGSYRNRYLRPEQLLTEMEFNPHISWQEIDILIQPLKQTKTNIKYCLCAGCHADCPVSTSGISHQNLTLTSALRPREGAGTAPAALPRAHFGQQCRAMGKPPRPQGAQCWDAQG